MGEEPKIKAAVDQLRQRIEQTSCEDDSKSALFEAFEQIVSEIRRIEFKLDRAIKEKQTVSTLMARTSEDLEKSSEIIKKIFGRYLSTEVMNSLLEDPAALDLGGEKRRVTIMMTDLRGFSAMSERLSPEQVVKLLNVYFDIMVDIILKYHGTINEIIGDALLVIFGAPNSMPDRTRQAVACAIEMQNAMSGVNQNSSRLGLPDLEMGIGINETEVIVGNIGSDKRSKYAVVGSGVNMTARLESYSVGGQVLVSETVQNKIGDLLRIDGQQKVNPKGMQHAMDIYSVSGIAGNYNLSLVSNEQPLKPLAKHIPFTYLIVEDKEIKKPEQASEGILVKLSKDSAKVKLGGPAYILADLQMELTGVGHTLSGKQFYAKLMRTNGTGDEAHHIRFTSLPPEIDAYFQAHLQ